MNFRQVSGEQILDRLGEMKIHSWNYRTQDEHIRHIGPTAQDFHAAFGVVEDNRHISSVDADGVALTAIQALHRVVKSKDEELRAYKMRVQSLESRLSEIEARLGPSGTVTR